MEGAMPCKMETVRRLKELRDIRPRKSSELALCKLMSPQESVWNLLVREIVRITSLKMVHFITSQKFVRQIYSYASSDEHSRCKRSQWKRMGGGREDPSMAVG